MIIKDTYAIDSYDNFLNRKSNETLVLIDEISETMCNKIATSVCDYLYSNHQYIIPNENDLKEKIQNLVIDYFVNLTSNISMYIKREKKVIFDNVSINAEVININPDEILRKSEMNQQLLTENFIEEISPVKNMISRIIDHINFRNQVNPSFRSLDINIENNIERIINEQFNKYTEEFNSYISLIVENLKNESYQFNSYVYNEKDNNLVTENTSKLSMESVFENVQNNINPFSADISNLTEEQKNKLIYGKEEIITTGKSK